MQLRLVLFIIAQIDVRAVIHRAAIGRDLPRDDVQQRGFADAVRPDDRHAVARAQVQIEIREQRAPIEALLQIVHHQHIIAGAPPRFEGKPHLLFGYGFFNALQLFQLLFAALRRLDGFFTVVHAVALDDRFLTGDFRLLQFVFLHLPFDVRAALYDELIIIALVLYQMAHRNFRHAIAHGIQKISIVADYQH